MNTFLGRKHQENGPTAEKYQDRKSNRTIQNSERRDREEDKMTVLRFQTGERHQTSLASPRGIDKKERGGGEGERERKTD